MEAEWSRCSTGRAGPRWHHPHREGLQRCFGWRPDHDDNERGADDNDHHFSTSHNDHHRTTKTTTTTTTTTEPPTTTTTTTIASTTTTTSTPHDQAPTFTSDDGITFRHGVFSSFTVTASGSPQPSLKVSGSLPTGLSFDRTTGVLSGDPKKSGFYRLTFTASNGIRPTATQSFALAVD